MASPYEDEREHVDLRIGRGAAYAIIYLFLLLITLPPLYRNLSDGFGAVRALFTPPSDTGIVAHLRAAEEGIENAPFADAGRRALQGVLTSSPLREGNRRTFVGHDGWLYFRTAMDALTGYGPLVPEPDSVTKDPHRPPWRSPLEAITTFASQLAGTDTELLLVPIPTKPMIYPEHLGIDSDGPIEHPHAAEFYGRIAALPNVEVLDPADVLWKGKMRTHMFLKQDTHWTPAAMDLVAAHIDMAIARRDWYEPQAPVEWGVSERRSAAGDLVEKLGLGGREFPLESVSVTASKTPTRDRNSPVVLLGDSFTNIYSDAVGLSWGAGAGLAEVLAGKLQMPLDVIAINGGGASEVREALAARKGSAASMREKKLVIWAIAARDLFLSESTAAEARVEWRDVVFKPGEPEPPAPPETAPVEVRARLLAKSEIGNPQTTTYTALLYAAEYELLETLSGTEPEVEDGRFLVLHWAFRDRKHLPSSEYTVGVERTMSLVPFDSRLELKTLEQSNDSELFVDLLWELEPEAAGKARKAKTPLLPASGCTLFALLLGLALWSRARSGKVLCD